MGNADSGPASREDVRVVYERLGRALYEGGAAGERAAEPYLALPASDDVDDGEGKDGGDARGAAGAGSGEPGRERRMGSVRYPRPASLDRECVVDWARSDEFLSRGGASGDCVNLQKRLVLSRSKRKGLTVAELATYMEGYERRRLPALVSSIEQYGDALGASRIAVLVFDVIDDVHSQRGFVRADELRIWVTSEPLLWPAPMKGRAPPVVGARRNKRASLRAVARAALHKSRHDGVGDEDEEAAEAMVSLPASERAWRKFDRALPRDERDHISLDDLFEFLRLRWAAPRELRRLGAHAERLGESFVAAHKRAMAVSGALLFRKSTSESRSSLRAPSADGDDGSSSGGRRRTSGGLASPRISRRRK